MVEHKGTVAVAARRVRILARGRVQGVGFRPTLYRAAVARGCAGSIRNTPEGVVVEVEGRPEAVREFVEVFEQLIPPRARLDELRVEELEPTGQGGFVIDSSSSDGTSLLPIPPDMAICPECAREIRDARDRRGGYAFNTCTCCGPRFTIARAVPFDRPTSAMTAFPLCEDCRAEYDDPADRRFHAQTMSCPTCGPALTFLERGEAGKWRAESPPADPLGCAREMIRRGGIVAVKGLGGFHVACDATREEVVQEVRRRKGRPHRPLAVMVAGVEACRGLCRVSDEEAALLISPQAPIVLLEKRPDCPLADGIAPGLKRLGVMLPYTPLHVMLLGGADAPRALVMTSCNRREEPIATTARELCGGLGDIADGVLTHDRDIVQRCDDSVAAVILGKPVPMRRSRGYVPDPILLDVAGPAVLGVGAMWKNTFCLTSGRRAFLSQHVGDVSDADNAAYFAETVERFSELLRLEPEVVACDMHPDYPTTAFARELARRRGLPLVEVQHHHAHVAACLAENGRRGPVIGVSMDGTGYGEDGAVWGGEFLVADRRGYERRYHLEYVPMPGGEQAIVQPDRMALAHLAHALGAEAALERMAPVMGEEACRALLGVAGSREFSPLTSSCGRLFDAVAALLGVRRRVTYEGQAACELEAICDEAERGAYEFSYSGQGILLAAVLRGICEDLERGAPAALIAARFHNTVSAMIVQTCRRLRQETGIGEVAMSGGVMQNRFLLSRAAPALEREGFCVLLHARVPPGDGGICLGQVACAIARRTE